MKALVLAALAIFAIGTSAIAEDRTRRSGETATPPNWTQVRHASEAAIRKELVQPAAARIEWTHGFRWGAFVPLYSKRKVAGWTGCGTVRTETSTGRFTQRVRFIVVYNHGAVRYSEIDNAWGEVAAMCRRAELPPAPLKLSAQ